MTRHPRRDQSVNGPDLVTSHSPRISLPLLAIGLSLAGGAVARAYLALPPAPDPVETTVRASWQTGSIGVMHSAEQDPTQRDCTSANNRPPDHQAVAIMQRAFQTIVYPEGAANAGDWRAGADLARVPAVAEGAPPAKGQCTACHQLEPGDAPVVAAPSLIGYGRLRGFAAPLPKLLYEQVYNSNVVVACSLMPRFGEQKLLSPEQIRDIVAYLMSPDSPVNAPLPTTGKDSFAVRP